MLLKLKSVVTGSASVNPAKDSQTIVNGGFTITSLKHSKRPTGDSIDEITEWEFDFKRNPEWGSFSSEGVIKSAKLTMTLRTNGHDLGTDFLQIKFGALQEIELTSVRNLPKRENSTIEIDLLKEGYTAQQLMMVLNENNGVVPMFYHDDAFICYAELEIMQEVATCSCKRLYIQATSEDVIAEPGNRLPNYLVLSITDADGHPVPGIGASHIQVDPLVVGPGGSLVNVIEVVPSSRIDGFYVVKLQPISQATWKAGTYVFAIVVNKGGYRGQALASVLMD